MGRRAPSSPTDCGCRGGTGFMHRPTKIFTTRRVRPSSSVCRSLESNPTRSSTGRDGSDADDQCPNCGAALTMQMAGRCDACRVKVQRGGDFDWVLSKVEQDEAYRP